MEKIKEIKQSVYEKAHKNAWSKECMEAHGAGGRPVKYIGGRIGENLKKGFNGCEGRSITDFYQDNKGDYWFEQRALLQSGEIISMERFLFASGPCTTCSPYRGNIYQRIRNIAYARHITRVALELGYAREKQ